MKNFFRLSLFIWPWMPTRFKLHNDHSKDLVIVNVLIRLLSRFYQHNRWSVLDIYDVNSKVNMNNINIRGNIWPLRKILWCFLCDMYSFLYVFWQEARSVVVGSHHRRPQTQSPSVSLRRTWVQTFLNTFVL